MDPVEPVDGAEARQGQNIGFCARAICALTESTYSRIRARIVRTRITPNTWESFTTRTIPFEGTSSPNLAFARFRSFEGSDRGKPREAGRVASLASAFVKSAA